MSKTTKRQIYNRKEQLNPVCLRMLSCICSASTGCPHCYACRPLDFGGIPRIAFVWYTLWFEEHCSRRQVDRVMSQWTSHAPNTWKKMLSSHAQLYVNTRDPRSKFLWRLLPGKSELHCPEHNVCVTFTMCYEQLHACDVNMLVNLPGCMHCMQCIWRCRSIDINAYEI